LSISTSGRTQITGAIYSVCTNFKLVGWFQGNDTNVILVIVLGTRLPGNQGHGHRPQQHKARGRCRGVQVVPVLFGPPHWLDCGWGAVGTASTRTPKHRRSLREAVAIRRRPAGHHNLSEFRAARGGPPTTRRGEARCLLMRRGFSFPSDPFNWRIYAKTWHNLALREGSITAWCARPCRPWKSHTEKTSKAGAFGVEQAGRPFKFMSPGDE
jgi:hypothetical protein